MAPRNESELLAFAKLQAKRRNVKIVGHAWVRMSERGVSEGDVLYVLAETAFRAAAQPNARWKVDGYDLDGDNLGLVLAIEADVIVVTLY